MITNQKVSVGKSTLTFNLAANLRENANVCIVDMDSQGSMMKLKELSEVPIFPADDLKKLRKGNYDFIFIDTPPYLAENLPKLCELADVIIIPPTLLARSKSIALSSIEMFIANSFMWKDSNHKQVKESNHLQSV